MAALPTIQELASRGGSGEGNGSAKLAELADGGLRSTEQAMDPAQPSCAPDLDRHRKQEQAGTMMKCILRNLQRVFSVSGKFKAFQLAHEVAVNLRVVGFEQRTSAVPHRHVLFGR